MPDIFDFLSTRTDTSTPTTDWDPLKGIDLYNGGLLPKISADARKPETEGVNLNSVLDDIAKKVAAIKPDAPAYDYNLSEEKRYSNPYMQYNPYGDIEDLYGQRQSGLDQLANGIIKGGANAVGTFASHFAMMPHTLDLMRSGKYLEAFEDDTMYTGIQQWLKNMEDEFPNFYTKYERDNPILSGFTPTGAGNFWGDKVIKNIGFSMGTLAAGLVTDIGIEAMTAGYATPAVVANRLKKLSQMTGKLYKIARNLNKASMTDDFAAIAGSARTHKQLIENLTNSKTILNGSRMAASAYLTAQTEAHIEGYHNYVDFKAKKYEEAIANGVTDPSVYAKIEDDAQNAARWTTGINLPIIMASNYFQFANLMHGRSAFGEIGKQFLKAEATKDGLRFANTWTKTKRYKQFAKDIGADIATEGGQEGAQALTGNSIIDYYLDSRDPDIKGSLLSYTLKNAPEHLKDPHLWEEVVIGGITGALMGGAGAYGKNSNERIQKIVDQQNNTIKRFEAAAKQFSITNKLVQEQEALAGAQGAVTIPGTISKERAKLNRERELRERALFHATHDSLYLGTNDMLRDSIEDLRNLTLDDFNNTFGHEFTEIEKKEFIEGTLASMDNIKQNVQAIEKAMYENPFKKNPIIKRIKGAFNPKSVLELENLQDKLFEQYKETMAYSLTRLQKSETNLQSVENELLRLGANPEFAKIMLTSAPIFSSKKGLGSYLKWKGAAISNLRDKVAYYEKLTNRNAPNASSDEDIAKEKKEAIKELERLEKFVAEIETTAATNADFKDKEINNKLHQLILKEEVNAEDYIRLFEEMAAIETEIANEKKVKEGHTKEQKEPDTVAGQVVDAAALTVDEVEPGEPSDVEAEVPKKASDWKEKFTSTNMVMINGKPYLITRIDKDGLVVQKMSKKGKPEGPTYKITEKDGKYFAEGGNALNRDINGEVKLQTTEEAKAETAANINQEEANKATEAVIGQSLTDISNANLKKGQEILNRLGKPKTDRLPNGNVAGGQTGWKIRFNIKNPTTGKSYYTPTGKGELIDGEYRRRANLIINKLNAYFQIPSENKPPESKYSRGDGMSVYKHMSGGEYGESDFTIYLGSAEDVQKFIQDMYQDQELMEILDLGNLSSDSVISGPFKGRIEGSDIGMSGYNVPTNFNKVIGEDIFRFGYKGDIVEVEYTDGNNIGGVIVRYKGKTYNAVTFPGTKNELKEDHPQLYENLRNYMAFALYGEYLLGPGYKMAGVVDGTPLNGLRPETTVPTQPAESPDTSIEAKKADIERRRQADLSKMKNLIKEAGLAFQPTEGTVEDALKRVGRFFKDNFGWKFEGKRKYPLYASKENKRAEFDIDGLEVNLQEGQTFAIQGGGSVYPTFAPQDLINAKYNAELAALEIPTETEQEVTETPANLEDPRFTATPQQQAAKDAIQKRIEEMYEYYEKPLLNQEEEARVQNIINSLLPEGYKVEEGSLFKKEGNSWKLVSLDMSKTTQKGVAIANYFNDPSLEEKLREAQKQANKLRDELENAQMSIYEATVAEENRILATVEGIMLRRDWSLGLANPIDAVKITKEPSVMEMVEGDIFTTQYFLADNDPFEVWAQTEQELIDKLNNMYAQELEGATNYNPAGTFTLDQILEAPVGMVFIEVDEPNVGYVVKEKDGEKTLHSVKISKGVLARTTKKVKTNPTGPFLQFVKEDYEMLQADSNIIETTVEDDVRKFVDQTNQGYAYENLKYLEENGDIKIEC